MPGGSGCLSIAAGRVTITGIGPFSRRGLAVLATGHCERKQTATVALAPHCFLRSSGTRTRLHRQSRAPDEKTKGSNMTWRRVLKEYESHLFAKGTGLLSFLPKKRGKVEFKEYADGNEKLSIKLRKLDLPQNEAVVAVAVNGQCVAEVNVVDGSGRLRLTTEDGDTVPKVDRHDIITALHGEEVLCTGKAIRD